jgi:hypothetical protein
MEKNSSIDAILGKLPPVQREAVENLLSAAKPFKPVPSALRQWLAWMILASLGAAAAALLLGPQAGLLQKLTQFPSGAFLALVFLGSALAAWGGIASSMPGEEPGRGQRIFTAFLLLFLFGMPFLFFGRNDLGQVLHQDMAEGWFCFRTVGLVAVPSWLFLGWMVSRNASFRPGWTGAWLGVSAFLLGTGTIQMHCARWESCHMFVDHMLPMVFFIALPIWIGSFWFSRWKK